jgi:hypothetical protein
VPVREALASSYEDLRRLAVAGGSHGVGTGLALFLRSGMARWMEVCIELLDRPAVPPPPRPAGEQHRVSPAIGVEVAMVLAQMALSAHAQGEMTC